MTSTLSTARTFVALTGGIAVLAAIFAFTPASEARPRLGMVPASQAKAATRIEIDNRQHAIRFYVNGAQVSMLDADGQHAIR